MKFKAIVSPLQMNCNNFGNSLNYYLELCTFLWFYMLPLSRKSQMGL